jgi:hypothetical protein
VYSLFLSLSLGEIESVSVLVCACTCFLFEGLCECAVILTKMCCNMHKLQKHDAESKLTKELFLVLLLV